MCKDLFSTIYHLVIIGLIISYYYFAQLCVLNICCVLLDWMIIKPLLILSLSLSPITQCHVCKFLPGFMSLAADVEWYGAGSYRALFSRTSEGQRQQHVSETRRNKRVWETNQVGARHFVYMSYTHLYANIITLKFCSRLPSWSEAHWRDATRPFTWEL